MVIANRTAREAGLSYCLDVPAIVLTRADEIIE
jgi:hypothetical protein